MSTKHTYSEQQSTLPSASTAMPSGPNPTGHDQPELPLSASAHTEETSFSTGGSGGALPVQRQGEEAIVVNDDSERKGEVHDVEITEDEEKEQEPARWQQQDDPAGPAPQQHDTAESDVASRDVGSTASHLRSLRPPTANSPIQPRDSEYGDYEEGRPGRADHEVGDFVRIEDAVAMVECEAARPAAQDFFATYAIIHRYQQAGIPVPEEWITRALDHYRTMRELSEEMYQNLQEDEEFDFEM